MTSKLTAPLREAPATVPALVAIALFVVWATSQGGYPVTHWAPGGLIVLVLLCMSLAIVRIRVFEIPVPVRIALGCLAAYTVLSFLSILWAQVPGEAWEGANRTLLYLLVFALFACWPQQGRTAALVLGTWVVAMIVLAAFTVLHVDAAAGSLHKLEQLLPGGRLVYPSGYANANAAEWLMAFWPALLLARSKLLPWALRGLLGGGAVLLAETALFSQSRGSLYATPVMLVLVFALLPGRVRTFAILVPIAVGIGVTAPAVVHVSDHLEHGQYAQSALRGAIANVLWASLAVALVVAVGAVIESRWSPSSLTERRLHRGLGALAISLLLVGLIGGWAASGNPVTHVRHAWDTFKSEKGYQANSPGSRLTSGLGSTRYDLYRVALDEFLAHPVLGIGADNIQQQYLRHGRSEETPRYPHSVEIRTLVETGFVGALLAVVGLGAALLAAGRALRARTRADPLAGAVTAAALAGFGYWVVHGSFDWFWEFAGLGAPAFAMLGLCCALARRSPGKQAVAASSTEGAADVQPPSADAMRRRRSRSGSKPRRPLTIGLGALAVITICAIVATLALPWFSQMQIERAAHLWTKAPHQAYADLNEAASLNPLSAEPYLVAGNIALRFGDLELADRDFASALERSSDNAYATLERGAIASEQGRRSTALRFLKRAAYLNPRNPPTRQALRTARSGKRVSVSALNREILLEAERLV